MRNYKIAVMDGDGIGPEVIAESVEMLPFIESLHPNICFKLEHFDRGTERYLKTGTLIPKDGLIGIGYQRARHCHPLASILYLQMMLSFFEEEDLANAVSRAVACHVREGKSVTHDMGGMATTEEMGRALRNALENKFAGSLS